MWIRLIFLNNEPRLEGWTCWFVSWHRYHHRGLSVPTQNVSFFSYHGHVSFLHWMGPSNRKWKLHSITRKDEEECPLWYICLKCANLVEKWNVYVTFVPPSSSRQCHILCLMNLCFEHINVGNVFFRVVQKLTMVLNFLFIKIVTKMWWALFSCA